MFPIAGATPGRRGARRAVSIACAPCDRGRIAAGEHVVVLGAGPIGQSLACRGAGPRRRACCSIDLLEDRLETARALGADGAVDDGRPGRRARARWIGGDGPQVVIDATGVPAAVEAGVEIVTLAPGASCRSGCRATPSTLRLGSFTEKELDVLGVACCGTGEFAEPSISIERNAAALRGWSATVSARGAPEALAFAMEHPDDVMKVVIRVG